MSAEKLGDYLGSHNYHRADLWRIHLAYKIEKKIGQLTTDPIRVIIRGRVINVVCSSSGHAKSLERQQATLKPLIKKLTGSDYNLKFRVSSN